ncbi:uncharacterized protein LOC127382923 [Apus apus]|uniref:uncharacterized protein LOC127382923 n=1 Tax=Apus apus TaxID=8895 RepID=UPI0021F8E0EA|nr:uncharacterized protein LOC127382923 [Apus apus]
MALEEEEEEDGPGRQPEDARRTEQVPVNGQPITSANTREKKLLKPKKKKKAQCSDKEVPQDLSVEKDKLREEEGVWQTKISSREKRHLRKEKLKQKGTWDIAEVKSCPVTFGTLPQLSRELDDPSTIDPDSDWKAPVEEWGNWTGDEEHQTGDKKGKDLPEGRAGIHPCLPGLESKTQRKKKKIEVKEARGGAGLRHPQQGLERRMEEDPRALISTEYSSGAVCASFRKSLDIANNAPPSNGVPGKKERKKRKKMEKET